MSSPELLYYFSNLKLSFLNLDPLLLKGPEFYTEFTIVLLPPPPTHTQVSFMHVWKSQRIKVSSLDACGGAGCSNPEYRSQAPSGSWQSQAPKVLCEHCARLPTASSFPLSIVLLRTRQANSLYHLEIQNEFCFFVFFNSPLHPITAACVCVSVGLSNEAWVTFPVTTIPKKCASLSPPPATINCQ